MELHGGSLHIESQPGTGSTVVLTFPSDRVVWQSEPARRAS
jgi:signal transduction histidine kinase